MNPKIHPFQTDDGHYCSHEFGTRGRCNRPEGNAIHDLSKAPIPEASYVDTDNDLIDRGVRRCLEEGRESFSSNDFRAELDRVAQKKRPGLRLQEWEAKGLIRKLGRTEPSNNPKAKGHHVQMYGPGPNWKQTRKTA